MVAERVERGGRDGVHTVRPDERLHVLHVGVGGILGSRARPERALHAGPSRSECRPARAGEALAEQRVGEFRVRYGGLTEQGRGLRRANRGEPLVHFRVHTAHEEAGDAGDSSDVPARGNAIFETDEVGVDDARVRLHGKQQRDVDIEAVGDQAPQRPFAGRRSGNLDHHVRPVDRCPQPMGLLDRGLRVVRGAGRHLNGHKSVAAVRCVVDPAEDIARGADVVGFDQLEQLPRGAAAARVANLFVVAGALSEGLLENRRIRRHTGERVCIYAVREFASAEHRAIDKVQPNRDARGVERAQRIVAIRWHVISQGV